MKKQKTYKRAYMVETKIRNINRNLCILDFHTLLSDFENIYEGVMKDVIKDILEKEPEEVKIKVEIYKK